MTMQTLLRDQPLILMEAAVNERLRRSPGIRLHPRLVNAALIYEAAGRAALSSIYLEYMDIAAEADLPLLLCAPTWRAGRERVDGSDISHRINSDAVHFMRELRDGQGAAQVFIGGLLGPRGDCYLPEQGLSSGQAREYHGWQIEQLVSGGADYLLAETLPNVNEALGLAQAMADTALPYIVSFVINRNGRILDGHSLQEAITLIDRHGRRPPLGYMINCAYPDFLCPEQQPPVLFERLIGCQANASSLDHCELDQADHLHTEPVEEWGRLMRQLNQHYGVKILGGCCGTSGEHLRQLIQGD